MNECPICHNHSLKRAYAQEPMLDIYKYGFRNECENCGYKGEIEKPTKDELEAWGAGEE